MLLIILYTCVQKIYLARKSFATDLALRKRCVRSIWTSFLWNMAGLPFLIRLHHSRLVLLPVVGWPELIACPCNRGDVAFIFRHFLEDSTISNLFNILITVLSPMRMRVATLPTCPSSPLFLSFCLECTVALEDISSLTRVDTFTEIYRFPKFVLKVLKHCISNFKFFHFIRISNICMYVYISFYLKQYLFPQTKYAFPWTFFRIIKITEMFLMLGSSYICCYYTFKI